MRRLLIVAALVLAAAAPAHAAPGALDPTFGSGGLAALGSGSQVFGDAMAIADDGKILVAGSAGNEMAVARFLPDGAPDPTFDDDGFAFIDPSPGVDAAYDIAALRNGRSVVVGLGQAGATANDTAIVLLDDHGHPDPAFNGSGKRVIDTSMSAHGDEAEAVVVQPDGKILVAGYAYLDDMGSNSVFVTLRISQTGELDNAWDGDGIRRENDFEDADEAAYDVVLQGNRALVLGRASAGTGIEALKLSDGSLDTSFNSGTAFLVTKPGAPGLEDPVPNVGVLDAGGRLVLAGEGFTGDDNIAWAARVGTDGKLDQSFGTPMANPTSTGEDGFYGLSVAPDGKIVAVGPAGDDGAMAVRLLGDGSRDPSFGSDGLALVPGANFAIDAAVLPDARIVLGATGGQAGAYSLLAARLEGAVAARSIAAPELAGANAGHAIPLTFTVSNGGPQPSEGTAVALTLPAGASLQSAAASQGACSGAGCTLGALGPGATATVTATVAFATPGDAAVGATVSGTTFDPSASDDTAQAGVHVTDATAPTIRLTVTKRALRTARRTGRLKGKLTVDEAAAVSFEARRGARRVARKRVTFAAAGVRAVTLKLGKRGRRAAKLNLKVTAKDAAGNVATLRRHVRLRRR